MQTATTQESRAHGVQQHGYRGRVRSGCLTCRSRKVKCDELRPVCKNCTRLSRRCVYKPRKTQQPSAAVSSPGNAGPNESVYVVVSEARRSPETGSVSVLQPYTYPGPLLFEEQHCVVTETLRLDAAANLSWGAIQHPFLSSDSSIVDVTARLENVLRRQNGMSITAHDTEFGAPSPSTLISRDIKLTTTMDILTARELPLQPSFSFFVEAVDCPSITPYDGVNWRQMKLDVVELGMSNTAVASAIIAVSALYKGQLYSLPLSKTLLLCHSSKSACEKLLNDKTQDFGVALVVTFLLCLFEFIHYETIPILKEPSEVFIKRLGLWRQHKSSPSELCSRIMAWLRLLHVTTIRGGGMGLISASICSVFPCCKAGIPNLRSPSGHHSDPSTDLYRVLSTPIFEFYFQLQIISGEMARLTHYHRSRITGVDQEEVIQQMAHVKSRLHALWGSRSATQRQTPEDLRSHLAPKIANPIITLIGVCTAAYHAEFVEMDRILGDPVSESTDSRQAMRRIREIVDGDYNTYDGGKLNSGYLRPLFLYAIECMDRDENHWAVERLEQIKNPICRSDFFASFGKALSDAQLRKERRVTSKYFCIWYFGVPPPFM
ncbi:hypothetical protein B7463_g12594, partial [Scytalidium lignicola]